MIILISIKQHLATFETQFTKKLSTTEAELKKRVAYKKKPIFYREKFKALRRRSRDIICALKWSL